MNRIEVSIGGMTCTGCARHVRNAIAGVSGVQEVHLPNWQAGTATVTVSGRADLSALEQAVRDAGYELISWEELGSTAEPDAREDADYDLLVVGGGSAAFAAAHEASVLGRSALIVNEGPGTGGLPIGGTCVNAGCVPSKALIRAAEAHHDAGHHPFDGITSESDVTDFGALIAQVQELVRDRRHKKYLDVAADDSNVTVREGRARLVGPRSLEVDGETITGSAIVLATGARTFVPDIPGLEEAGYLTNERLYELDERPEHLLVLGGGYIALENAQAFARLGSEVTVLERSGQVLSEEDADVAEAIDASLREEGITIHTDARVRAAARTNGDLQIEALIEGRAKTLTGSHLLLATGLRGNTRELGLEALGIETLSRDFLAVDERLQTAVPGIYGAGDVIGDPAFVYTAAREGTLAAENALTGAGRSRAETPLPWVIFTDPQVAGVGLGERAASEQDLDVEVATLPLDQVPRALVARDARGFIKLLRETETGRLVGARIVAPEGGELLPEVALAIRQNLTAADLTDLLHPYLTLSEGIKLAALAFDREVENLSCCVA